jgi:acetyltransferase-like isoleucine patch superfamily enzyme
VAVIDTAKHEVVGTWPRAPGEGPSGLAIEGVIIGDRAIIGAGAVVTQDVPAGQIAAGNPARILPPRVQPQP